MGEGELCPSNHWFSLSNIFKPIFQNKWKKGSENFEKYKMHIENHLNSKNKIKKNSVKAHEERFTGTKFIFIYEAWMQKWIWSHSGCKVGQSGPIVMKL